MTLRHVSLSVTPNFFRTWMRDHVLHICALYRDPTKLLSIYTNNFDFRSRCHPRRLEQPHHITMHIASVSTSTDTIHYTSHIRSTAVVHVQWYPAVRYTQSTVVPKGLTHRITLRLLCLAELVA